MTPLAIAFLELADEVSAKREARAREEAKERAERVPSARAPLPPPDWRYQRACLLCGGTESGDSWRGFVGNCTCEVVS
jgi:hypothetical protein